jgi:CubicO group peptidase (beta-lactamase class C family)
MGAADCVGVRKGVFMGEFLWRAMPAAFFLLSAAEAAEWPACGRVDRFPGEEWRSVDPGRRGWDESRLAEAQKVFESQPSAAVMVIHRGRLIADWGSVAEPYTAQSVRKGLVSSLVGQLVAEGRLDLDATLEDMAINDVDPPLSRAEKQATLRDLLRSRSGIFHSALYEVGGWTRERMMLAEEERAAGYDLYPPGAYWIYNNWDFNAVGTIIENAAGETIGPHFARKIAEPTKMQDFRSEHVEYTTSDHPAEQRFGNVSSHRAYVFNISTRDLARYGLLYLNCGKWARKQIVPKDWVLESIVGPDTREGRPADRQNTGFGDYGYLWQIDRPGSRRFAGLKTREPFYIASGARGHLLTVFPYLDLVIAHQVATVGGVSMEAQKKRALEGSPEVTEEQTERLLGAIIKAHPHGARAYDE